MISKRCSDCGLEKPLTEFYDDVKSKDFLERRCKSCKKAYYKGYYQGKRDVCLERSREFYKNNKEWKKEYSRRYDKSHTTERLAYMQRYYQEHLNQYRTNRIRRRALEEGAEGSHTRQDFLDLCSRLQWRCFYGGGLLTPQTATEDHMVPYSRGGSNDINNIVPACQHCNSKKGTRTAIEYILYLQEHPEEAKCTI